MRNHLSSIALLLFLAGSLAGLRCNGAVKLENVEELGEVVGEERGLDGSGGEDVDGVEVENTDGGVEESVALGEENVFEGAGENEDPGESNIPLDTSSPLAETVQAPNFSWDWDFAANLSGNGLLVWVDKHAPNSLDRVAARLYLAGVGWQAVQNIDGASLLDGYQVRSAPKAAMSDNGDAFVVWLEDGNPENAAPTRVQSCRYQPGLGWNNPVQVGGGAALAGEVQIALDKQHANAMAVWYQIDSATEMRMYANHFDATGGWGAAEPIEPAEPGGSSALWDVETPRVVMNSQGAVMAVWGKQRWDRDVTGMRIMTNHYETGTGWGAPALIDTSGDSHFPETAFAPNGDAWALWAAHNTQVNRRWNKINYAVYHANDDAWDPAAGLDVDSFGHAYTPQLIIDDGGNVLAAWLRSDANFHARMESMRFTAGGAWSSPEFFDADNGGDIAHFSLAANAQGQAVAGWTQLVIQNNVTRAVVFAGSFLYPAGWSTPGIVDESPGDSDKIKIAVDATGGAMAAWNQYKTDRFEIFVSGLRP